MGIIKTRLRKFVGEISETRSLVIIGQTCWDFAESRDKGWHRGVENNGHNAVLRGRELRIEKHRRRAEEDF